MRSLESTESHVDGTVSGSHDLFHLEHANRMRRAHKKQLVCYARSAESTFQFKCVSCVPARGRQSPHLAKSVGATVALVFA